MQSTLIRIGNSKGVRLPASILKEYEFESEVVLELLEAGILIKPAKKPRAGWTESFKKMRKHHDDVLLMDDVFKDEKLAHWK